MPQTQHEAITSSISQQEDTGRGWEPTGEFYAAPPKPFVLINSSSVTLRPPRGRRLGVSRINEILGWAARIISRLKNQRSRASPGRVILLNE